jgi:hypothetical protein
VVDGLGVKARGIIGEIRCRTFLGLVAEFISTLKPQWNFHLITSTLKCNTVLY